MTLQSNQIVDSVLHYVRLLLPSRFSQPFIEFQKLHDKVAWLVQAMTASLGPVETLSDTEGKKCSANYRQQGCESCRKHKALLSEDDLKLVLQKLGMNSYSTREWSESRYNSRCNRCSLLDGVSILLEEKEASMEELKEAFSIFDANGDGYVDARELQKVLCRLGFEEGMKLEDCEKMINAFDGNGDGRIDLSDFRSMLENAE